MKKNRKKKSIQKCCVLAASKWFEQHRLMHKGYYWNAVASGRPIALGTKHVKPANQLLNGMPSNTRSAARFTAYACTCRSGEGEWLGSGEEEGGKKTRTAGLPSASKSVALLTVSSTAALKHFATKDGHFLSGPQWSLISPLVCGWNMWKHLLSATGQVRILRFIVLLFLQHCWEIHATLQYD